MPPDCFCMLYLSNFLSLLCDLSFPGPNAKFGVFEIRGIKCLLFLQRLTHSFGNSMLLLFMCHANPLSIYRVVENAHVVTIATFLSNTVTGALLVYFTHSYLLWMSLLLQPVWMCTACESGVHGGWKKEMPPPWNWRYRELCAAQHGC